MAAIQYKELPNDLKSCDHGSINSKVIASLIFVNSQHEQTVDHIIYKVMLLKPPAPCRMPMISFVICYDTVWITCVLNATNSCLDSNLRHW